MSSSEVVVEFDTSTQHIGALREAAYRAIAVASCVIERVGDRYSCRLIPKQNGESHSPRGLDIRQHFIDLVTDENLREKVSQETAGVRNVILALAFGALTQQGES